MLAVRGVRSSTGWGIRLRVQAVVHCGLHCWAGRAYPWAGSMIRPGLGRGCGCKVVGRWAQSWMMSCRILLVSAVVAVVVEEPAMVGEAERWPVQVTPTVPHVPPPNWVLATPHPEQVHIPMQIVIKYGDN